jgi:tetratricopeptide (TPR) repeat protein
MFKASMLILISFVCFGSLTAQQEIDPEVQRLNRELGESYLRRDYNKAHAAASRLVEIMRAKFGKDDLATAKALKNRGGLENFKGDPKTAAKTFEETIAIYKKLKGLSDHDLQGFADVLEALGAIRAQERLESAEGLFKQALEIREQTTGPESPEAATSLSYLANLNFWQRQYETSTKYYSRALASLAKSMETSRQDFTLIYYRAECSFRKAKFEDRFQELTKKYGPEGLRDDASLTTVPPRKRTLMQVGAVNGKAINLVKPKYPAEARADRANGVVIVDVLIDEKGNVLSACAAEKDIHPSLISASEASALRSTFSPTSLDGKPVKVAGKITFHFGLSR